MKMGGDWGGPFISRMSFLSSPRRGAADAAGGHSTPLDGNTFSSSRRKRSEIVGHGNGVLLAVAGGEARFRAIHHRKRSIRLYGRKGGRGSAGKGDCRDEAANCSGGRMVRGAKAEYIP